MSRKPGIIVGTDLATSERALRRAGEIAGVHGATIHVVHATSKLPRALRALVAEDAGSERGEREALASIRARFRAAGLSAHAHLLYGSASRCLRRKAREIDAALIVLGSRARSSIDAIVGSTAERVIERHGPPVLIAREPGARAYRRVVVALATHSDVRRSARAAMFVGTGAGLSLVHVCSGPFETKLALEGAGPAAIRTYRADVIREARRHLKARVEEAALDGSALRIVYGATSRVLCQLARRGTLMVLDRGDSKVSHALFGSVSRQVIEHSDGDIVLV